jgi:hypothetical protein
LTRAHVVPVVKVELWRALAVELPQVIDHNARTSRAAAVAQRTEQRPLGLERRPPQEHCECLAPLLPLGLLRCCPAIEWRAARVPSDDGHDDVLVLLLDEEAVGEQPGGHLGGSSGEDEGGASEARGGRLEAVAKLADQVRAELGAHAQGEHRMQAEAVHAAAVVGDREGDWHLVLPIAADGHDVEWLNVDVHEGTPVPPLVVRVVEQLREGTERPRMGRGDRVEMLRVRAGVVDAADRRRPVGGGCSLGGRDPIDLSRGREDAQTVRFGGRLLRASMRRC